MLDTNKVRADLAVVNTELGEYFRRLGKLKGDFWGRWHKSQPLYRDYNVAELYRRRDILRRQLNKCRMNDWTYYSKK
jgi:hypothetical protein